MGRTEEPEDARSFGSLSRRLAAEWVRRAGREATRRCPLVWQSEQDASGGMGRTEEPEDARSFGSLSRMLAVEWGGPRSQKMPARLAV